MALLLVRLAKAARSFPGHTRGDCRHLIQGRSFASSWAKVVSIETKGGQTLMIELARVRW